MELIPVKNQLERNKPRFLIDENCAPNGKLSPKFLTFSAIARRGTPDWLLLEKAKEMELELITRDKGLITRAISEGETIVYQTEWGDRFEVRSKLIESGCKSKKYYLSSKERRLKKVAIYQYAEYYFL